MSDDKAKRAITAAADVFLRYGYARTTMGDIAKAAGMSRPALYLLFPGKEQLFAAATMQMSKQRLEDIRAAIHDCDGLQQKLVVGFEMLLLGVFALQQTTPDARDMDDLSFPVVGEIYTMFVGFFAEVINEARTRISMPADQIARVLLFGLRGLREVAKSEEDFAQMIRLHIALVSDAGLGSNNR
jgi:AcrR family transcriptional regulator